jgi:cardiolipin synthase
MPRWRTKVRLPMLNLPNILTLSRIAAIPVVVACFWLDRGWAQWFSMIVFVAACVTDWFDGYFARRYHQISRFGRFLDPIADKLLVAAALLMLVDRGPLHGVHVLAALIILAREILVSGLREFLAELRVGLPVSQLAKWKTGVQMVAIALLLVGDAADHILTVAGLWMIWAAALLTLITGYDYLRTGLRHMAEDTPPGSAE